MAKTNSFCDSILRYTSRVKTFKDVSQITRKHVIEIEWHPR